MSLPALVPFSPPPSPAMSAREAILSKKHSAPSPAQALFCVFIFDSTET